jgi:threonine synthase
MWGFQAAGAAPLVTGAPVLKPETIATAIRIGNPVRGEQAMAAMTESGGGVDLVTDQEILAAYRMLAASEGVFCEPSSASSVAGLIKAHAAGRFTPGESVVCVLTGNGLKDPDTAIAQSAQVIEIPADYAAAEQALYGD